MKPVKETERKGQIPGKKTERLLFFDLLRIICVAVIVYDHSRYFLFESINQILFPEGNGFLNIYPLGLQGYAVFGMIFVSGAVLEYNYQGLERFSGYCQFLFRRFIRIYPAFWMSLILGIILYPMVVQQNPMGVLLEFTGFYIILGQGSGIINIMGWFIAAIVSLYILYPFLSRIVKQYALGAIIALCLISWGSRFIVLTYNIIPVSLFVRWFPLFNAFEFCLGIYIIQRAWYPRAQNTYPFVRTLADLSYYVFLFHVVVGYVFIIYTTQLQPLISLNNTIAMSNPTIAYTLYYLEMMGSILLVSWIAMKIDTQIHAWIIKQKCVKGFLNSDT